LAHDSYANSGVPYEIGLKATSLILCSTEMGLLIFKSPFPRSLRLCIPFTYYFFYQFGVISRTYSLMMLGMTLLALFYKTRNENPYRFIAIMAMICGASAYGIVICAGISIVWLIEIVKNSSSIVRDKRVFALLSLLLIALTSCNQSTSFFMVDCNIFDT